MKTCLHCGVQNGDTARFCIDCGHKFADEQPKTVSSEKSAPVSKEKILTVIFSYIAAYLFFSGFDGKYKWESLVILILTVLSVELLNKNRARPAESWVWLICFALNAISYCFNRDTVWEDYQTAIFSIVLGVWWTLSRSGKLMEEKSGHLLPADAWTGFAVLPFKNYLLRFRTILSGIRGMRSGKAGLNRGKILWETAAAAVCIVLFVRAANLLMEADSAFYDMLGKLFDAFDFDWDEELFANLFWSIPFGCLGCGLILGSAEENRSGIELRRDRLYARLTVIRRVPADLWIGVVCLFSVLYAAFFVLQASYLFGAFTGNLPEGFIVAEYARQGFFELCKVMIVNSVVLWLATRMVPKESEQRKGFKAVCLLLLAESILFSVIAFSKLMMYISAYGFTQLRLQSSWLVCVLFAACVLWIVTILTDRPVFRKWMIFGAATLSLLAVV